MKFKIGCEHNRHAQKQMHVEVLLENQKRRTITDSEMWRGIVLKVILRKELWTNSQKDELTAFVVTVTKFRFYNTEKFMTLGKFYTRKWLLSL